jgi:hypothetical protein
MNLLGRRAGAGSGISASSIAPAATSKRGSSLANSPYSYAPMAGVTHVWSQGLFLPATRAPPVPPV